MFISSGVGISADQRWPAWALGPALLTLEGCWGWRWRALETSFRAGVRPLSFYVSFPLLLLWNITYN